MSKAVDGGKKVEAVPIGGQFIGSDSSSSHRGGGGGGGGASSPDPGPSDNSFLYSADEDRHQPTKKKTKTKRAKLKRTNDDTEQDTHRSIDASKDSHSFDEFDGSAEDEQREGANAPGHRDSLRRMGDRLSRGDSSADDLPSAATTGADGGKTAGGKTHGKAKLEKFGKLFRKLKKGEQQQQRQQQQQATDDETKTTTTEPPPLKTIHGPETSAWNSPRVPPAATGAPRYAGQPARMTLTVPSGVGEGDTELEMDDKERLMKERQRKISHRKICQSVLVTVVLVLGFVLGIILTALSSLGLVFQIVGPTILGLSSFGLVGKVFVTVFWEEDPFLWTKHRLLKVTSRLNRDKKNRKEEDGTGMELRHVATTGAPGPPPTQSLMARNSDDLDDDTFDQYSGPVSVQTSFTQ